MNKFWIALVLLVGCRSAIPHRLARVVEPAPMPLIVTKAVTVPSSGPATNIFLAWDGVAGTNIKGYNVYRGTTSRVYPSHFSTPGTNASYLLVLGATNYFAVTAIDNSLNESDFSNEVTYRSITNPPAAPFFSIVTWASSNMTTWQQISTLFVSNAQPYLYFRQQILKVAP